MDAQFTSVILENGLVPIARSVQERLELSPGDQVHISIRILDRPDQAGAKQNRYKKLLVEKDSRILTPKERAELIALADGELDTAIANASKLVQRKHPELFDEQGQLKTKRAIASLRSSTKNKQHRHR